MSIGYILFSFHGRLNRKPYWLAAVGVSLAWVILIGLIGALAQSANAPENQAPMIILRLAAIVAIWWTSLALAAKRLHDRDKSAWFLILASVPLIGWIWFLIEAVQAGTVGENQFGFDPLEGQATIPAEPARDFRPSSLPSAGALRNAQRKTSGANGQPVLVYVLAVLLVVGGAAWLYTTKGAGLVSDATSALSSSDQLSWNVGYPKNQLNPPLEADTTHDIDGGGSIEIKANCDTDDNVDSISLTFSYFSKADKGDGANSRYDTQGSGAFEHVPVIYNLDGSETHQANSQTDFSNSARVIFAYMSPDAKVNPASAMPIVLGKLFGAFQDLQPFLHAHEVDFQLPIGGGGSEIVKLYPQDSGFQSFVSQCQIDMHRIDSEVAADQAKAKAASEPNVPSAPAANETAQYTETVPTPDTPQGAADSDSASAASASTNDDPVKDACSSGGVSLRVNATTQMESSTDNGERASLSAEKDQVVWAMRSPIAVSSGMCLITFHEGADTINGSVPLGVLTIAATTAAPASSEAN